MSAATDATVVGAGPNGLAAAIVLAEAGLSVRLIEAADTVGGGARTQELTLPGFLHDVCSAIHPLGIASPFLRRAGLDRHGVRWLQPDIPVAHPLDTGDAVAIHCSLTETIDGLGEDGNAWRRLLAPLVRDADSLVEGLLGPLLRLPPHPVTMARFGLRGALPATSLLGLAFRDEPAQAAFAGLAAHAIMPLEKLTTAGFALMMTTLAHHVGWPIPAGGSQSIADALAARLRELGGEVETGRRVGSLDELAGSRLVMLDVTPAQLVAMAGDRMSPRYRRRLSRFRYGPGVFKVDYALSEPVPWRAEECRRAGTVHLGGTASEIADSERAAWRGEHHDRPFVLVAQQSLFDPTRAPDGRHTLWAYCHVPHGSTVDMTDAIERQIERFAPGFRDVVLARHTMDTAAMQRHDENYVGGDINGGAADLSQFVVRPTNPISPYRTPLDGVYLCSSSTPPGGGVHGMCGYWSATSALRDLGVRAHETDEEFAA